MPVAGVVWWLVMTVFPQISPRILKGGIALIDPETGRVVRVIALQYNPETLSRTFQPQAVGGDGGSDRSQALRLTGPPIESYKLDAEIDAADQLDDGDELVGRYGIQPYLAALELLVYPTSAQLQEHHAAAGRGELQIAPVEAPLTLFIWSTSRVVPVRVTDFSVEEEFFDTRLNPIRAKVSLGMRVLSVSDLGYDHRGGSLYLRYQQEKERLAATVPGASPAVLGLREVPS
ncbi:hypothetical protein [Geodermatophilus amargosae]|uniref:hypothetical protein n=1 Tax=Geodermatophilus amargosae TaxID=1296565 RepID=UPI0034DDEF41